MSEKFPTVFEATEKKIDDGIRKRLEAARENGYDYYPEVPAQERREPDAEIIELENLMERFELDHPLEDLFSITEIPTKGSDAERLRESAKLALNELATRVRVLEEETTISTDQLTPLWNRRIRFAAAVGAINGGRIRHD